MSSRLEGFDVMDVSTSLPNDPKIKRLAREHPEQLGPGFLVYVSTMAESWKAGTRVPFDDAWPGYLDFDQATVDALKDVRLLDPTGRVTTSAWRGYFVQARNRREKARERWRRANEGRAQKGPEANGKHPDDTPRVPRGRSAVTTPPSDSVTDRTESSTTPPTPSQARGRRRPRAGGPIQPVTDYDALMQRDSDDDWLAEP